MLLFGLCDVDAIGLGEARHRVAVEQRDQLRQGLTLTPEPASEGLCHFLPSPCVSSAPREAGVMTWDCSLISAARIDEHLRLLHAGARCARLPRGDATLRVVGAALGAHGAVPVLDQRRAAVCTYRTAPDGRLLHARRGEEPQPSAYSLARLRSNADSSKRSVRHPSHRCGTADDRAEALVELDADQVVAAMGDRRLARRPSFPSAAPG